MSKIKFVFPSYNLTVSFSRPDQVQCSFDEEKYDPEEIRPFVQFITAGIQAAPDLMLEVHQAEDWERLEGLYEDWLSEVQPDQTVS